MNFKGMDALAKHIPELNSSGGKLRIALYALGLFALVNLYFILTDNIPTWSIDSEIIISSLGFLLLGFFFSRKQKYREKYKELAYRKAFAHYALPGLALIFGAVAHAGYMNGPFVPQGWWTILFLMLGWFMCCSGGLLWVRSVFFFGADNLALLYVYHPEKGRLVGSGIYSILRHPVYAAALRVWVGLALLNGNANSILFSIFVPLGLTGWIRLVEEKELIERFGPSYLEYRSHTPAFLPRLRHLGLFYKFLLRGGG